MATCSTCGGAMLTEQPHRHPDPLRGKVQRPPHNHPTDSHCLIRECPRGAWDAAMGVHLTGDERLREAAQAILDRCLDFFDADDLDPESSEAMPVVIKNRWVYALRAALALLSEEPDRDR